MHFKILTVLCVAILVGIASSLDARDSANWKDDTFADLEDDGIDIDLEGSGGDFASGSGHGPPEEDDEDDIGQELLPGLGNAPPPVTPRILSETTVTTTTTKEPAKKVDDVFVDTPKVSSFFAQPGILAAVIGGAVVGLLCAILVVMFIVYRMRKKDEGSYALYEPKVSLTSNSLSKGKEFYAWISRVTFIGCVRTIHIEVWWYNIWQQNLDSSFHN